MKTTAPARRAVARGKFFLCSLCVPEPDSMMECWLITSRAEVKRLEFGDEPPPEICLPDKPLAEIEDNAVHRAIQDAPYIIYRRYHLAHESWRLGIVYSIAPPTVGDIQILSAYRAGHEARPHLVDLQ